MAKSTIFSLCRRFNRLSGTGLANPSNDHCRKLALRRASSLESRSAAATSSGSNSTSEKEGSKSEKKLKILYDGGCSLCAKEMDLVRYLNKDKNLVELVDITKPGYNPSEHNNITFEEAMAEMHVIDQNNKVHKRVPATHTMYSALGHGWMTCYTNWPILAPLFDKAYGWFARNRLRWTNREHVIEKHKTVQSDDRKQ